MLVFGFHFYGFLAFLGGFLAFSRLVLGSRWLPKGTQKGAYKGCLKRIATKSALINYAKHKFIFNLLRDYGSSELVSVLECGRDIVRLIAMNSCCVITHAT